MLAEKRDFASHFRVSYDIFLFIMEAARPVFSVCTHDGMYVCMNVWSSHIAEYGSTR